MKKLLNVQRGTEKQCLDLQQLRGEGYLLSHGGSFCKNKPCLVHFLQFTKMYLSVSAVK